jgi:hypothetical protein
LLDVDVGYGRWPSLVDGTWLNWRPDEALRWKVETTDWEGRGVVCGKPAPLSL